MQGQKRNLVFSLVTVGSGFALYKFLASNNKENAYSEIVTPKPMFLKDY